MTDGGGLAGNVSDGTTLIVVELEERLVKGGRNGFGLLAGLAGTKAG